LCRWTVVAYAIDLSSWYPEDQPIARVPLAPIT
jgi:hypothetical protein